MDYFNFIYCFVILIASKIGVEAGADHKKLLDELLSNYNILERPVLNENDTVTVKIGLMMMSILELNMQHNYLESNLWFQMEWVDVNLRWNASDYGGIESLSIPPHRIWKPDILLYNSIHPEFDSTYETLVSVNSDGNCSYIPPGIHKTSCRVDVRWYPFDYQRCSFKFGSWTTDGGKIALELYPDTVTGDLTSFIPNPEWEVLEFPARVNKVYYACCPDPFVDVTFTLQVKRRGDQIFSGCTFALAVGTILTILSLLLPPNSGNRVSLGLVTVVIMYVLGYSINTTLGGEPNRMVYFFFYHALLTLITLITNVIIIYIYTRNPTIHRMAALFRKITFEYISPFLLLKRPTHDDLPTSQPNTEMNAGNRQYEELVTDLEALVNKVKGQRTQNIVFLNDWEYFGIILDRVAFVFYIIAFIVFFISYFAAFP